MQAGLSLAVRTYHIVGNHMSPLLYLNIINVMSQTCCFNTNNKSIQVGPFMGLDAKKPVFVVCEQQRCRLACTPRNLISAFVILLLESITSKLSMSEISVFQLVSAAEQAVLNLTLLET